MPDDKPHKEFALILSHEDKQAIRDYLSQLLVPPAIIGAVISFLLGYFIQEGAHNAALAKAVQLVQETLPRVNDAVISATTSSEKAKLTAEIAEENARKATRDVDALEKGLKELTQIQEALKAHDTLVNEVSDQVINNKPFQARLSAFRPLTLLDTANQYVFVNHGTGELNTSEIQNMSPDGAIIDCRDKVPAEARGVIIALILLGAGDHRNALFVCSDANGSFYEPRNHQAVNGIFNYSGTWTGGILLCPFLTATKQFKYLVGSEHGTPDTTVLCRGTVIGWF
jgi:hypothetical protein